MSAHSHAPAGSRAGALVGGRPAAPAAVAGASSPAPRAVFLEPAPALVPPRDLVVEVPASALPVELARPWCVDGAVSAAVRRATGATLVVVSAALTGGPQDAAGQGAAPGASAPAPSERPEAALVDDALVAVTAELAGGDLRLLHLAWLAAVQHGWVDDDAVEPAPPAGLDRLSDALVVLADELGLSPEMIEASAPAPVPAGRRRPGPRTARTAGELLHREAVLAVDRARRERAARTERARQWQLGTSERDAAQARRLLDDAAAAGGPGRQRAVWAQVEGLVRRGTPADYRSATTLLAHLRAQVAAEGGAEGGGERLAGFDRDLAALRRRSTGRGLFLSTLDRAGLTPDEG